MSNEENPKLDDELGLRVPGEVGHGDPLADTTEVISQAIPTGVDRRTFLMRSAVVGATAVMTGKLISAQERTGRSIAVPPASAKTGPAPPLSKDLNVVKKGQGP